jgi:AcrR family transcriptional regulator
MKTSECETREAVLRAGLKAFARCGYSGASVQDIISATEFSRPTLYYYFGSKAGIYTALLDKAYEECYRRMKSAADGRDTLEEKLVEVLAAVFEFVREERDLTRLAFATAFSAPGEMPDEARNNARACRNREFFQSLIQAGLNRGELDSAFSTGELALSIHGAMVFRVMLHLTRQEGDLSRRAARRIVQLFLKGGARKQGR